MLDTHGGGACPVRDEPAEALRRAKRAAALAGVAGLVWGAFVLMEGG